ncbi:putative autotransporter heamagglutinin [Escherichia coli]|uniref:Putative autotransporter heamagglutinin n=1 Tax=Escherichia coli TaxID=562 RepID=A0A376YB68_ECOLX|nr:putative autotransporter heamagglutinin [Escherichia coli]
MALPLTMQDIDSFEHHGTRTPELTYADSGAKIVNKGTVEIQNLGFAFVTGENTTGINSGTISLLQMVKIRHRLPLFYWLLTEGAPLMQVRSQVK